MEFEIRQIGHTPGAPASIIELTVKGTNVRITEDITNMSGYVDPEVITTLRNIADELEEQNLLKHKNEFY